MDKTRRKVQRVPGFIRPMLCKSVGELPTGKDWVYEVKRGGERTIAVKNGRNIKLFHEDGRRNSCPEVEEIVREVQVESAVIDGEIICLDSRASTYEAGNDEDCEYQLYAWDLLHLNGRDLTAQPVERRKGQLCTVTLDSALLFSPSLACEPQQLFEEVERLSLDAVVAKRKGSIYESGQCTGTWMKKRVRKEATKRTKIVGVNQLMVES